MISSRRNDDFHEINVFEKCVKMFYFEVVLGGKICVKSIKKHMQTQLEFFKDFLMENL